MENLHDKSVNELKVIAKSLGVKNIGTLRKQMLIDAIKTKQASEATENDGSKMQTSDRREKEAGKQMMESVEKEARRHTTEANFREISKQVSDTPDRGIRQQYADTSDRQDVKAKQSQYQNRTGQNNQKKYMGNSNSNYSAPSRPNNGQKVYYSATAYSTEELEKLDSGEKAEGILEVMQDGYGFIRSENYLPGTSDIYVSPQTIRYFGLKTGDILKGNIRIKNMNEKFSALLYLTQINGYDPEVARKRHNFESMTPIFPCERIHLEIDGNMPMRIVDLIAPVGKGQRGMIVSPPKTGKTTLLKSIAKSISRNHQEMHMIVLLIDERPEEVTDIKESIEGPNVEVIYSTFDELPEHHKRVAEMVLERAKRLVEHGKEVVILLDSITRLARAYNLTVQASGRTLSGGLDPAALHMPKKFFGAARNMREGGSLTILATALVETGSKMDDVVFEEFKGTGNMELVLDRKLSEKRIFPAVDIQKSGTRRDDLLLSNQEQEIVNSMRKMFGNVRSDEAIENILDVFVKTKNNQEFMHTFQRIKF